MTNTSELSGFYKKSVDDRSKIVAEQTGITEDERKLLVAGGGLDLPTADRMIENVIGTMPVPLGLAVNFQVNEKDCLIPMAIEEPSVVAAASFAAKLARPGGGFRASSTDPVMIGQVQIVGCVDPHGARHTILRHKKEILEKCNAVDPVLVKFGGGARDVQVRVLGPEKSKFVVVHLLVDTRDAMGANAVNTMAETVAPYFEQLTGGRVRLRIISNLAVHRLARSRAVWKKDVLASEGFPGEDVVEGIIQAYHFAASDPYRCSTHNKGIMNGITACVLATGNDTRAIEAGAHSYAAVDGYHSLTTYEKDKDGNLVGTIELPMAVGLVGGATKTHPVARVNVKILGVKSASEMGEIFASVGLAQNFAALRALATEGIQRGHMGLHSRNTAVTAGATGDEVDKVAEQMVKEKKVRVDRAQEILAELRKGK